LPGGPAYLINELTGQVQVTPFTVDPRSSAFWFQPRGSLGRAAHWHPGL